MEKQVPFPALKIQLSQADHFKKNIEENKKEIIIETTQKLSCLKCRFQILRITLKPVKSSLSSTFLDPKKIPDLMVLA